MPAQLRYEIWTRRESGTYDRRFPLRGVVRGDFDLSLFGRGSFQVPTDLNRLDDLLSIDQANRANDKASTLRAFIGETPIADFYIESMEIAYTDTGARVASIECTGRGSALDRSKVRQYDWPADPSQEPDWQYGVGSNEIEQDLDDVGGVYDFEDGTLEGFEQFVGSMDNDLTGLDNSIAEARTGTRSLEFDPGNAHSGVQKTVSVRPGVQGTITGYLKCNTINRRFTMFVKAEDGDSTAGTTNAGKFSDLHLVELDNFTYKGGNTDGTWQSFVMTYTPGPEQESMTFGFIYDDHDISNGPIAYIDDISLTGFGLGVDPWEELGALTTLDIDNTPGYNAVRFLPANDNSDQNGIIIRLEGQEIGTTKTFAVDVYHQAGADRTVRLVLKRPSGSSGGSWLASNSAVVSSGTTARISVSGVMDSEIIWLLVLKGDGQPANDFWVSEQAFYSGFDSARPGKILNDLLDDAAVDHAGDNRTSLAWLTRTITDTLDSSGASWGTDVSMRIRRGQSLQEVIQAMENLGYEFSIDLNPADETDWRLNAYLSGQMGTDRTTTGPAILSRPGIVNLGPIIRREPQATYVMVEGDDNKWADYRDTAMETAWGELEDYVGNADLLEGSLVLQAIEHVTSDKAETIVVNIQGGNVTPAVDFGIGDRITVSIAESILPRSEYRVVGINIRSVEPEAIFQVELEPV
jgi:hypothetical protein